MTYQLFCIGNPLLDVQVTEGSKLLEKYDLKPNDAILASDKHMPIYDEIVKDYKPAFVAGGASQNAARGAAYVLPPDSVVYTGCVGDDDLADQLRAANKLAGLHEVYQVMKGEKTGACAVVITGHHRSLVTTLRAAEKFQLSHLASLEHLVDAAKVFYVEGFFLTHGVDVVLELSKKASRTSKVFALNLSAPFIPHVCSAQLQSVLPYCDIIICNESEAEAYAIATGLPDKADLAAIARVIAMSPKANAARPRVVIFTHGSESTVLVTAAEPESPKIFKVTPVAEDLIVDTNGAGDAFAGGFLGAFVAGRSLDECVEIGHKMGAMCIQLVGPQFPFPKVPLL